MKRTFIGILAGLALGVAGTWMFLRSAPRADGPEAESGDAGKPEEPAPPGVVKLGLELQTNAGLRVELPVAATANAEIIGYGRVLEPAPLLTALFDLETARTALTVSSKEHARVKGLFDQNQNASLQSLEAAEAAMKRDQLQVEAAQARLVPVVGRQLAGRNDLAVLAPALVAADAGLVRLELLPGQAWEPVSGARLAPLTAGGTLSEAEYAGPAPSADTQAQGLAYLFLMRTNVPAPGTAVVGHLPASGPALNGWRIPLSAVVRHEGAAWIYEQTGAETFERRLVTLVRPLPDGWLVTEGVAATNRLVVTGAQLLLSEQLKGAGGAEEEE